MHIYWDLQHAGQWNDANCDQTKAYICMAYKSKYGSNCVTQDMLLLFLLRVSHMC